MIDKYNFSSIYDYVSSLPAFSDHEHHRDDGFFNEGMSLDKALQHSYVSRTGFVPDGTFESRQRLLENVRFNSYFTWFEKGLQKVHGMDSPIIIDNWEVAGLLGGIL